MLFLPELTILGAGLPLLLLSLGQPSEATIKNCAVTAAAVILFTTVLCLNQAGNLFYGAYRVDLFSQVFKVLIAAATLIVFCSATDFQGLSRILALNTTFSPGLQSWPDDAGFQRRTAGHLHCPGTVVLCRLYNGADANHHHRHFFPDGGRHQIPALRRYGHRFHALRHELYFWSERHDQP